MFLPFLRIVLKLLLSFRKLGVTLLAVVGSFVAVLQGKLYKLFLREVL